MRNVRLLIEYDGGAYRGWQRQAEGQTVQGAIEDALATLLRERVTVHGAGRTDAGVHARGQVANFRTSSPTDAARIAAGLNGLLPPDVVVLSCGDVPGSFHARFGATGRRYSYTISTAPAAIDRRTAWEVRWALDEGRMARAAASVVGTHDFTSFCCAGSDVRHHVCVVRSAAWTRTGRLLRFDIASDRFLRGMVRALVGSMVDVGRGHTPIERFLGMLAMRDRREAGPAAPPCGLVLEEVYY